MSYGLFGESGISRSSSGSSRSRGSVGGANGDHRGFNENNHDGVVDDDVYFARFKGMTYSPVKDDPLSATLPVIGQTR